MLSEEALLLVLTLVACGFLALGIWELLAPARSRRRARTKDTAEREDAAASDPEQHAAAPTAPTPLGMPAERAMELADETVRRGAPDEIDRRLWRSYTNLGLRQIEEGKFEDALDPLFHALRMNVGPDRLAETRLGLVRAFEGIVDERATMVRQLAADGDPRGAERETERLSSLLQAGIAHGLPQDDLADLLAGVRFLSEDLARKRA